MKKVGIFIASLAASSAIVISKPVAAATFNFSFQGAPNGGTLSFNGPVPTGTVQLSQLNNASLSYIFTGQPALPTAIPLIFGPGSSNVTLDFANGNLIGITDEATLTNFSGFYTFGSGSAEVRGDYTLFFTRR